MIARLHTYNALRATTSACDAYRMARMHEHVEQTTACRAAHQPRQAPQAMPIQLDGPHYGRKHQRRKALLRAARTLVIVAAIVVGVPLLAGIAYGLAIH